MEMVKQIMWDWRYAIIVVIAVIIYAVFEWQSFKVLAYKLMLVAKKLAQKKILEAGQPEEDWTVEHLYDLLPKRITLFVSKDLVRKIVYKLYHVAKDLLDDGKLNNSIV